MFNSWWLLWMFFVLFLVAPTGYGWGYRRWGAPYTRYIQRRRAQQAVVRDAPPFNHHAWGVRGDLVWFTLIIWLVWVSSALWWR